MKTTNTTTTTKGREVSTMQTTTTEHKNTFTDLLRAYEQTTISNAGSEQHAKALQELSTACALSVLKKLHRTSAQATIAKLRAEAIRDSHKLEILYHATNEATAHIYNENGDLAEVVMDKAMNEAVGKLCRETLGDGLDLVHTATVAILAETARAELKDGFMEEVREVRRLKKKVWIKSEDSVNGWETVETTPIQEVYKAIRREVSNNSGMQTASHKYTYIEDLSRDTDTDAETAIYRRLPKYSDLVSEETDSGGKVTFLTADKQTADDMDKLVQGLNLTAREASILHLRQSGHGLKAISTYLGISENSAKGALHRLREKALNSGLCPNK